MDMDITMDMYTEKHRRLEFTKFYDFNNKK
jgi:hypothetical protein